MLHSNSVTQTYWRMQVSSTIWFHFSAGCCICSHSKLVQDWIATNCSEFVCKSKWPPNLPYINPLDHHVWGISLEHYKTFYSKPKNTDGLKKVLQLIQDQVPQDSKQQGGPAKVKPTYIFAGNVWYLNV